MTISIIHANNQKSKGLRWQVTNLLVFHFGHLVSHVVALAALAALLSTAYFKTFVVYQLHKGTQFNHLSIRSIRSIRFYTANLISYKLSRTSRSSPWIRTTYHQDARVFSMFFSLRSAPHRWCHPPLWPLESSSSPWQSCSCISRRLACSKCCCWHPWCCLWRPWPRSWLAISHAKRQQMANDHLVSGTYTHKSLIIH